MSQWMLLEYECPQHGRFESLELRAEAPDDKPCPHVSSFVRSNADMAWQPITCGAKSPWAISSPRIKPQYATAATMAKSDGPPSPYYMDTEPLADGMPRYEFDEQRTKLWDGWRDEQIKKAVS